MDQRKYATEFTLVLTVQIARLGRQQDYEKFDLSADPPLHLYLVSRRPLVRVMPESVIFGDRTIEAVVGIQRGGGFVEHVVHSTHSFGPGLRWESDWPHDEFHILNRDGVEMAGGVVGHLMHYFSDWPAVARVQEVVYVGQAFGKAGERTAWDRLQSHSTVQRILAETSRDQQVWISMAYISDVQMMHEIVPGPTSATDAEDDEHTSKVVAAVYRGDFAEKEAVALAEAGMIRYFQPQYNDRLKYNFPARKSVPLETARGLDLHGLIVEIQSEGVRNLYGSPVQQPAYLHFAGFAVHTDEEREISLALQAATGPVVIPPAARSGPEGAGG